MFASASGGLSASVVIVSRPLELTPLLDTIYLMPGDTITVPIAIAQKNPGAPTRQFDPSPMSSVYAIDANTGLVTAQAAGGPILYRAHLTDGVSTVSDSGAIVVMSLTDTTSGQGRFFMTTFGTAIRHQSGGALAVNYERLNGKLAFQLVDTATSDTLDERVLITLPDSVLGTGPPLEIDSISPDEVNVPLGSARDPRCTPPRPWALWASIPANPQRGAVVASAHGTPSDSLAGSLSITQYMPLQSGGAVIGGRYRFQARRFDLYSDPLGAQTIRGTFVAPLRERHTTCPG